MGNTMSDLTLRAASAADVPALSRLAIDSFVAKFGHMYRAEDLSAFLDEVLSEPAIAAEVANPDRLYRLAERDGRLLAYCKLGLTCGFPEHARGNCVIELKQLYTAADATGGGLGSALMDWALGEANARGCDEMQLSVWSGNDGAQRFYARYGFAKVADIHFMVGQQRDEEFLFAKML
jgi:ribosomal protein S18 acetylase RimI-like enzyme